MFNAFKFQDKDILYHIIMMHFAINDKQITIQALVLIFKWNKNIYALEQAHYILWLTDPDKGCSGSS